MSRTVSARIPIKLHEELRDRCNLLGESVNDYVKASIELALHGSVPDTDTISLTYYYY